MWHLKVLKNFNSVEACRGGWRGSVWFAQSGACNTRPDSAREGVQNAEREREVGHMAEFDWLAGFLSHFIFKLNYFIAN
jgi:hypothetical protein